MQEDTRRRQGAKLRALRLARGLKAAEVARRASMTPAQLWRYEAGRAVPGVDATSRLAAALGMTIDELVHGPALPGETVSSGEPVRECA